VEAGASALTGRVALLASPPVTLRNRVTPLGELVADPARGLVYGNRGCLHDDEGRIRRRYAGKRWISCRLSFRGWRRTPLVRPGGFTELFFLDEATAMAAGHRPCALCRREDYVRFGERWRQRHPRDVGADAIDSRLHLERLGEDRRTRFHEVASGDLADGAFAFRNGAPWLVLGGDLRRWTPSGYAERVPRPRGLETMTAITPPSLLHVLRGGWEPVVPQLHPSATD